jgi:hypothetical protein
VSARTVSTPVRLGTPSQPSYLNDDRTHRVRIKLQQRSLLNESAFVTRSMGKQLRMSRLCLTSGRMLLALSLMLAAGTEFAVPAQAAPCWSADSDCTDHGIPPSHDDRPNPRPGSGSPGVVVKRVDLVWLCAEADDKQARPDFTDAIGRGWCTKAKDGTPLFQLVTKKDNDPDPLGFPFGIRIEINRTSGTGPVTVGPFWAYDKDGPQSGEILGNTPVMVKFAEGETAKIAAFEFWVKCKDPDGDGLLGDDLPNNVTTGLVFGGSLGNEGNSHEGDKPWFPFKQPDPAEVNVTTDHDKPTKVSSNEFSVLCI